MVFFIQSEREWEGDISKEIREDMTTSTTEFHYFSGDVTPVF